MDKATVKQLLLEVLNESLGDSTGEALGFHSESEIKRQYVFVNRTKAGCLWYTFNNETKQHQPITHNKISGKITQIAFRETEYKGKPDHKLVLTFDCGHHGFVSLESSVKTAFSRITLLTLSQMSQEACDSRITLEVAEGTEESVILPTLYVSGQRQTVEFPENFRSGSFDMEPIIAVASMKINGEDEAEDF